MTNNFALGGVRVLECAGGIAGAYCGKLFTDMGAQVSRMPPAGGDPLADQPLALEEPQTAGLLHHYLNAGKTEGAADGDWDILILGEDWDRSQTLPAPRVATLDIAWFGHDGPYADWAGSDLVIQALSGMSHPCGPVDGPPTFLGEHQATMVGGVAAFCAGVAALIGGRRPEGASVLDVSILESVIIMSELQMANAVALDMPIPRMGVNRYLPTCPLSIHRCKEGWIGITPLTPAQWQSFCDILGLKELRDDPDVLPARTRYPYADRIEPEFDRVFPTKTAMEWAALGREHKVPMVIVPNAEGILNHPIFNARHSLAEFSVGTRTYRAPRTPLRLEKTPPRLDLDVPPPAGESASLPPADDPFSPLAGIRVADFSMGWAGPLATRMLSDLGAEVIKIEAGRYPDWWRSVDWSPEAIERGQYEESRHFSFINRGKQSLSLDLTNAEGVSLAKRLVAESDVVVENQAAGVMPRLGLGYDALSEGRDDLIMLSMSAFGSGNAWSDTRAYGSVLEQGSGVPSFVGREGDPPTMAHVAYGDPIGGIYGAASLLAALYHRKRCGEGQWINNTQIEAMLPFTTAPVLFRQATGKEPPRRGNRHARFVPHGIFPSAGKDCWLAISLQDDASWPALAKCIGRTDWGQASDLATAAGRRAREAEIEAAIADWSRQQNAATAANALQSLGIAAAAVAPIHMVEADPQLHHRGFFYDTQRPHIGQHYQAGLPFRLNARRYPMRGQAPFLGGDSENVLCGIVGLPSSGFRELLNAEIVSQKPTSLRS